MCTVKRKLALWAAVVFTLGAGCDSETIGVMGFGDGTGGGKLDAARKKDGSDPAKKDGGGAKKDSGSQPAWDQYVSPDMVPPGKPEICGNGFDDDKDGLVDEGCGCKVGATQACYPLPQMNIIAPCKKGTQACVGGDEFGKWGACTGAVIPKPEICGDGYDQNCDGLDPPCPPKCGDGKCNGTEDCLTCPKDCGPCPTHCDTFTFGINARPIDIAFIVDQSGSMSTEIAGVKSNLNAFSTYIAGTQVDYHVVMLARRGSPGSTNAYDICIPPPLGGANCADGQRYKQVDQTVASTNELTLFQAKILDIESFMRPTSLRQIVVITDDNSSLAAASFQSWITARTGWSDYLFHSIVSTVYSSGCTASIGTVYQSLTSQTGGFITDLCNANWNAMFTQLGKAAAGIAIKQYALTKKPLGTSLTVTYNGTPKTQGTDYDYDAAKNQLNLKGTLPPNNAQIKVCYPYKP